MRFTLKLALILFALGTIFVPMVKAQTDDDSGDTRLLSSEQGQALAEFALQSERHIHPKPDCSHLVHLLYARAGLIYTYEDSRVLYRGISDFERVKASQPGDLVVWPGHVGIVLVPEENTFLSSVRSGILTESWSAAHWVRRGRPRFYRYRISVATNRNLLAAIVSDGTHGFNENQGDSGRRSTEQPFSARTREPAKVEQYGPQADHNTLWPQETNSEPGEDTAVAADSTSIVAVIPQRQIPTKQQIATAIIESRNAHARRLIEGETLDLRHPVSVFNRLEVEKVKFKHENGSITLKLSESLCQQGEQVFAGRILERELSISRRMDGVWVIADPGSRTYLPQEQALEIFERQAEIFLRRTPNSSNTRGLVKALDRLYDQQPGTPQRAAIR
jgi:cell wall-associated NlpC family hydrolase